jgi:hypothetical protein
MTTERISSLRSVINEVTKLVVELARNSLSKQLLEGM